MSRKDAGRCVCCASFLFCWFGVLMMLLSVVRGLVVGRRLVEVVGLVVAGRLVEGCI